MRNVIVGIDRSETAGLAAKRAAELAAAYGDNLHIVMCVDRDRPMEVKVGSDSFRLDTLADAEQFVADVGRKLGADQYTHAVRHGDPAKILCEEAAKLDTRAIVVGNRRVQGMARVLGSVATDVVKHAPCDVLVANTTHSV
jgi:nucleotide-binding universal stress UspA family protein